MKDWAELEHVWDSNGKTNIYQRDVIWALEDCFPLVTVKRRSSDPPGITGKSRKELRRKKGIYRREGRSGKVEEGEESD